VQQCLAVRAALCGSVWQSVVVRAAVCGSAHGSVVYAQCAWQCAVVRLVA
jgi:hypothetical protein